MLPGGCRLFRSCVRYVFFVCVARLFWGLGGAWGSGVAFSLRFGLCVGASRLGWRDTALLSLRSSSLYVRYGVGLLTLSFPLFVLLGWYSVCSSFFCRHLLFRTRREYFVRSGLLGGLGCLACSCGCAYRWLLLWSVVVAVVCCLVNGTLGVLPFVIAMDQCWTGLAFVYI